ncbi:MAG TPA: leucyl aminopeptidase, partial [Bacteroidetes bacterium]|nr:leucyl aminopeptidase [Bacteroidota bacterium]
SLKRMVSGIDSQLDASSFRGKEQEVLLLYPSNTTARRMMLAGLGKSEGLNLERLRRSSATAAKSAKTEKAEVLALFEPDPDHLETLKSDSGTSLWENVATALAEGAVLGAYKFDKYISKEKNSSPSFKSIVLISDNARRMRAMKAGMKFAQVLCEATCFARDLENAPGNEIYPESLARKARESGRRYGFKVTVFDEKRIKRLGMGGLIGVSQGSDKPPRFIVMEHNDGKKRLPTIALVGKGVTFDSGGISIKPSANMAEMKMDMSGAAAVIGTMQAIAQLKLPLHVVGLVPATENLLGGSSVKPGDILRHYNGKTSEVDNTDAEGRLILADALAYAAKYKPDVVIDLATLTGACVVALGHFATGMLGNDQQVMDRLKESGERTYERVWQLPMFEEYEKLIKSDIADVKNVGGRWAGAITAAMFLKKFIGNYRWVHLDIAGTAIMEESLDYIPKGGSGVGVRLLTDFLRHWKRN